MSEEREYVYRKEYRMRAVGVGGVEMTIPKVIIERAARKAGQTIEQFIKTHKVVHLFNNFSDFDAAYRFTPMPTTEELEIPKIA